MILTLERNLKRANRALLKSVSRSEFVAQMRDWRAHLNWMRLHIAYFEPLRPRAFGQKTRQQNILDELVRMAEHGIRIEGYQPPEAEELRRIMRMYASSADNVGYFSHI